MTVLTEAYVLRKSQRGDFDRQYVLLTKDLGKISVLAKGAMKITSKLAPHLDFFCLSQVMVAPGQSLFRLAGANLQQAHFQGEADYLKCNCSSFLLEIIDTLIVEKQSDVVAFDLLASSLTAIAASKSRPETHLALNRAVFELLSHLGYRPLLQAKNQLQLTSDLHRSVLEAGEREIKSFAPLQRELAGSF